MVPVLSKYFYIYIYQILIKIYYIFSIECNQLERPT